MMWTDETIRKVATAAVVALALLMTAVILLPSPAAAGEHPDLGAPAVDDARRGPHEARATVVFRAVAAANAQRACAVGNDGIIYSTLNGGKTWRKRVSPVSSDLVDVCYASPSRVWAVSTYPHTAGGMACAVIYSTNGGRKWQLFTRGHMSLLAVDFVSRYYGFVGGAAVYRISGSTNPWTHVASAPTWFGGIDFVNRSRGWAIAGIEGVFRTDNGGRTWQTQGNYAPELWDLSMLDRSYGWITGGPHQGDDPLHTALLRTTNGGRTWVDTNRGFIRNGRYLYAIACANRSVTWAVGTDGSRGFIYRTSNGGKTWRRQRTVTIGLDDVCCVSRKVAWTVGGKRIYKTRDGKHWYRQK